MTHTAIPPRSRTSSATHKVSGLPTFTTSLQSLSPGTYPSPARQTRTQVVQEESPANAWLGSFGTTSSNESPGGGASSWLGHGGSSSAVVIDDDNAEGVKGSSPTLGTPAMAGSSGKAGLWEMVRLQDHRSGLDSPAESALSASDYLGHGGSAFGTEKWLDSATSRPSSPTPSSRRTEPEPKQAKSEVSEHITNFPLFAHHHPAFSTPVSPTNSVSVVGPYEQDEVRRISHVRSDSFFSDPGPDDEQRDRGMLGEPAAPTSFSQLLPLRIGSGPRAVQSSHTPGQVDPSNVPFSPASAFLSSFSGIVSAEDEDKEYIETMRREASISPPRQGLQALSMMAISESPSRGISPPQALMRGPRRPSAPDAAGSVVLGYTLGKVLGRGGFSTVRLATHNTTGEKFACRIIKRDDLSDISGSVENFEKELELWKAIPRHQSILPLMEMYRDPRGSATYLISPYMSGGSLLDVLKRDKGSEKMARKWFPGVVAAVKALHEGYEGFEEGGILHGDLKLDNFLVGANGEVCVCDFGLARKIGKAKNGTGTPLIEDERRGRWSRTASRTPTPQASKSRSRTRPQLMSPFPSASATLPTSFQIPTMQSVGMKRPESRDSHSQSNIHHHMPHPRRHGHGQHDGHVTPINAFPSASLPYAPPELLRAPPAGLSLAQDMWAVGIILHALLTSRLPFVDTFDPRLQMKIIRGDWAMPEGLGREWQECLLGLLDGNRDTRWNISRLAESDAVVGWSEVKLRSKSRSRSRSRRPQEGGDRDHSASRNRGNDRSLPSPQSYTAHLPHLIPPSSRNSSYHDVSGMDYLDKVPEDGERVDFHRNLSAAWGSRSRSSGRGEGTGMFALDGMDVGLASVPGPRSPSQRNDFAGRSRSRSRARQV